MLMKRQNNYRERLLKDAAGACIYCGRPLTVETMEIDHIVPRSKGGAKEYDNLVCSCPHCNALKGDKDAADFVYISCDDWQEKIKDIDVLYLVSAWHGLKNDDWLNLSREGTPKRKIVYSMIDECKKKHIPVVFYSKEDYLILLPFYN